MTLLGLAITLFLIYLLVVSVYSDITQPRNTAIIRDTTEGIEDLTTHRIQSDINHLQEYALLSASVYADENYEDLVKGSDKLAGLWQLVLQEHTQSFLDRSEAENISGLYYQVYQKRQKDKELYAIVFRGTDSFVDFQSNLHWAVRLIPGFRNQYDFVRVNTKDIVAEIYANSNADPDAIEIIATGHSLGGGLAQQAAYAVDNIKTVYAYAPSSVTGFFDVKRQDRNRRTENLRIFRIYERGEILAYMRLFMKILLPVTKINPKIVEIRFNFEDSPGKLFSAHSMKDLAKNMMKHWAKYS